MPLDVAFGLLEQGSGTDFDIEVVKAFKKYYYKHMIYISEKESIKIM
jgi:hypothetical protein